MNAPSSERRPRLLDMPDVATPEARERWRPLQELVARLPVPLGSSEDFIREKRREAALED